MADDVAGTEIRSPRNLMAVVVTGEAKLFQSLTPQTSVDPPLFHHGVRAPAARMQLTLHSYEPDPAPV